MTKSRKAVFSATKAVKANARERVGQPKPEMALPSDKQKAERRSAKHKANLSSLIEQSKKD